MGFIIFLFPELSEEVTGLADQWWPSCKGKDKHDNMNPALELMFLLSAFHGNKLSTWQSTLNFLSATAHARRPLSFSDLMDFSSPSRPSKVVIYGPCLPRNKFKSWHWVFQPTRDCLGDSSTWEQVYGPQPCSREGHPHARHAACSEGTISSGVSLEERRRTDFLALA